MTARSQHLTLGALGGLFLGILTIIGGAWALSTKAAVLVVQPVDAKVTLVDARLADHLQIVHDAAAEMRSFAMRMERKMDRLCAANKVNCE